MRIRTRLMLAVFVPLLMMVAVSLALVFSYRAITVSLENGDLARQVRGSVADINNFATSYMLHPEERPKQQFLVEHDKLAQLTTSIHTRNPDQQRLVDDIRLNAGSIKDIFLRLVSTYESTSPAADAELLRESRERLVGQLQVRSREVDVDASLLLRLADDEIRSTEITTLGLIFAVVVLATVPLTIVLARMRRSITTSLATLREGTEVIGAGNLQHRMGTAGGDELGELGRSFDDMTGQLQAITVSRDELEKEVGERRRVEEALFRSSAEFQLLSETAAVLLSSQTPEAIVQTICEKVMAHLNCDVFLHYLVDEQGTGLRLNAFAGIPAEAARSVWRLEFGEAVCGRVARDATRIVVENIQESADERDALVRSFGVRAYAAYPILSRDRVMGTLSFGTRSRTSFTPDELELMRLVTDQIATALERKQAEDELEKHRDHLEDMVSERTADLTRAAEDLRLRGAIMDMAMDGILIRDSDHNFVYVNEAACRIHGYTREEFMAMSLRQLIPPAVAPAFEQGIRQVVAEGESSAEALHLRKDGSVMPVEMSSRLVRTAQGDYIVSIMRDITRRKRAEQDIRTLSGRLVAVQEEERRSIARELHDEVGQRLTFIRLMLEKAQKSPQETAEPTLKEAVEQVAELLKRVRNLSLDLRPSMLDDLGLVPALLWLFERLETQSGLHVDFTHDGLGDSFSPNLNTAAYRIIQEALTNVVRHAGVKEASVRVWADDATLYLSVEEKGRGFDRAALATSPSTGLSAMRQRARMLGGTLKVESAPGAGTRITAELPLSAAGLPQ